MRNSLNNLYMYSQGLWKARNAALHDSGDDANGPFFSARMMYKRGKHNP
jgi:hypothetical protein